MEDLTAVKENFKHTSDASADVHQPCGAPAPKRLLLLVPATFLWPQAELKAHRMGMLNEANSVRQTCLWFVLPAAFACQHLRLHAATQVQNWLWCPAADLAHGAF